MNQKFMHIAPSPDQKEALTERLKADGFRVSPSQRMNGGVLVRVLDTAEDRAEVERIVGEVAPGAEFGPEVAASVDVAKYREGR